MSEFKEQKIPLRSRYGEKHYLRQIDDNIYVTDDYSRHSFDVKTEKNGKSYFTGITYIDFDGGPFMHIGDVCPFDSRKIIVSFEQVYENDCPVIVITTEYKENDFS